ncbi:PREDICTED: caspase recruitment domain-containing protein 6 [Chinchilla lanigera]|uniref:caspase recruitment domain-containing protein 6 n=1 Tax=Chinchilla lanigera TaxID=34839 RepID=UPI000695E336|nr:PREDICTED: caspase recruitment domain-containing protein 6 [Chinchilla lanigera]
MNSRDLKYSIVPIINNTISHTSKSVESRTHECLKHESIAACQSKGLSKNLQDTSSPGKKKPENPEVLLPSIEKEHLHLKSLELSRHKKTSHRETALSSRDNEEAYDTPKVTLLNSVEKVEYEIPATVTFLSDGQRYEEPDDSLYLGEGEYQESVGYSEDAETTMKEGDCEYPEYIVYGGKEA